MQNIYDDPRFFAGYRDLRDSGRGLNDVLEQPALRALLPPLSGLCVLDLGCGEGSFARWCAEQGAASVVGVDLSRRMLELASERTSHLRIAFIRAAVEEVTFAPAAFDLVVSSWVFHYVRDYPAAMRRIAEWLRPGGRLVFSIEHPVMTAQVAKQGWVTDHVGRRLFWALDDYADEGERRNHWFVEGIVKYHRRVATLVNGLIDAGLVVERLDEPEPLPEALTSNVALVDERRRPPLLLARARKPA